MRALSIAMVSIYLVVGSAPCGGGSAERPARSARAEATVHAHEARASRAAIDRIASDPGDPTEATSALRPQRPCDCGGGLAAAPPGARFAQAIAPNAVAPAPSDLFGDFAVERAEQTEAPPQVIDHVPITA